METKDMIKQYAEIYDSLLDFPTYLRTIKPSLDIPYGRDFEVCCPLHEENTPSFKYKEKLHLWRCFGKCNTGGKVTKFHYLYMKKQLGDIGIIDAMKNLQTMFPHILPPMKLSKVKSNTSEDIVNSVLNILNPKSLKEDEVRVMEYSDDSDFFLRMFLYNVGHGKD